MTVENFVEVVEVLEQLAFLHSVRAEDGMTYSFFGEYNLSKIIMGEAETGCNKNWWICRGGFCENHVAKQNEIMYDTNISSKII